MSSDADSDSDSDESHVDQHFWHGRVVANALLMVRLCWQRCSHGKARCRAVWCKERAYHSAEDIIKVSISDGLFWREFWMSVNSFNQLAETLDEVLHLVLGIEPNLICCIPSWSCWWCYDGLLVPVTLTLSGSMGVVCRQCSRASSKWWVQSIKVMLAG